jgi:hypothetical protein
LNLLNHAIVNQQHAILAQQLQRRRKVWWPNQNNYSSRRSLGGDPIVQVAFGYL